MAVNGFPRRPTPGDCIHYLTCKVTNKPLPNGLFLHDLDPYSPSQLPCIFSFVHKTGELYLFTRLYMNGKFLNTIANRKVGNGTWHHEQSFYIDNVEGHIGMSNKFTYHEKGSQCDRLFRMTEYTLPKGTSLQYDPLKDYVLCHIVKSETTTNHQVAAVFKQPEPTTAVQPFDTPSPAPQDEQDD